MKTKQKPPCDNGLKEKTICLKHLGKKKNNLIPEKREKKERKRQERKSK